MTNRELSRGDIGQSNIFGSAMGAMLLPRSSRQKHVGLRYGRKGDDAHNTTHASDGAPTPSEAWHQTKWYVVLFMLLLGLWCVVGRAQQVPDTAASQPGLMLQAPSQAPARASAISGDQPEVAVHPKLSFLELLQKGDGSWFPSLCAVCWGWR